MMSDYNDITKAIQGVWPKFQSLIMVDEKYILPSFNDLLGMVSRSKVKNNKYKGESFDCDDFALLFHAYIIEQNIKKDSPLAIGQFLGSKVRGKKIYHAVNIAITSDKGVILIEPQTNEVWQADSKKDSPVYIRF